MAEARSVMIDEANGFSRRTWLAGALALLAACGGGGSGDDDPVDTLATRNGSVTADAGGVVAAGTSLATPAGVTLTFPEAATLTDAGSQPVTGAVATTVTRSTSASDLPAAAATLPADTSLVAFVELELGAVRTIDPAMTAVLDAVPPAAVADTLVIYEFNGSNWARGESLAVGAAGAVQFTVPRPALWAALRAPPDQPRGVTAVGGDGKVTVTWTASAGATAYDVAYGTAAGAHPTVVAGATSPAEITGLTNGTPHYFVVVARNAQGASAPSGEKSATPEAILQPPTNPNGVTASGAGMPAGTIRVVWNPVTGATSYRVYHATAATGLCEMGQGANLVANGEFQPFAASPGDVTGLASGVTHCFVVTALNAAGEGPSIPNPKTAVAP